MYRVGDYLLVKPAEMMVLRARGMVEYGSDGLEHVQGFRIVIDHPMPVPSRWERFKARVARALGPWFYSR